MESTAAQCVMLSTDADFRDTVKGVLSRMQGGIVLGLEIVVPYTLIGDDHLNDLREVSPELIFLDVESDPEIGMRFAQFLSESDPGVRIIAAGPLLTSEQLLDAMRAGITEYLPKPATKEALTGALDRVERKMGFSLAGGARNPGRVISIFSAKGGAGSTSLATNLAIHLHKVTGKKTLLIDLDLELGEIALLLGVSPRFNFVDMVRSFHRMDAGLLASYIEHHESGVHLLSAPYTPNRAEIVTGEQIKKIVQFLRQHYQFVIVDTSKSLSPATFATFEQSDQILLLTAADLPSLRNLKRCLPLVQQAIGGTGDHRLRLVLSRYSPADAITIKDIEKTLELKVYGTVRNDYQTVVDSINSGRPAVTSKDSKYSHDIRGLAASLAGLQSGLGEQTSRSNERSGLVASVIRKLTGRKDNTVTTRG